MVKHITVTNTATNKTRCYIKNGDRRARRVGTLTIPKELVKPGRHCVGHEMVMTRNGLRKHIYYFV